MTIQDWGALGEMIGGVAVVVSLVYVAVQIRQNTQQIARSVEATRLAAFERNIESANRIRELMMLNPDLGELYLRGLKSYRGLESFEKFRFGLLMRNTLTAAQGAYLRHTSVGGDPLDFEGATRLIDSILDNPGVRTWLEPNKADWRPEFRSFIEERLANLDRQADRPNTGESPARDDPG